MDLWSSFNGLQSQGGYKEAIPRLPECLGPAVLLACSLKEVVPMRYPGALSLNSFGVPALLGLLFVRVLMGSGSGEIVQLGGHVPCTILGLL